MKKWEYMVDSIVDVGEDNRLIQETLSEFGRRGWELIHVSQSLRTFIFKREEEDASREGEIEHFTGWID